MDHDAKVIHWKNEIKQLILNTQALYPVVENSSIQSMVETTNSSNAAPQISSTLCGDTRLTTAASTAALAQTGLTSEKNSTAAHASVSGSIGSQHTSLIQTYKLVGDNLDEEVKPRHMHSEHQTCSLHYFHTYAVKDRIDIRAMSDQTPSTGITSTHLSTLLFIPLMITVLVSAVEFCHFDGAYCPQVYYIFLYIWISFGVAQSNMRTHVKWHLHQKW